MAILTTGTLFAQNNKFRIRSYRVPSKNGPMLWITIKSNKAGFLLCNSNLSFSLDCNESRDRTFRIPVVFLLLSFAVEDADDNIVFEEGQGVKMYKADEFCFCFFFFKRELNIKINQKICHFES